MEHSIRKAFNWASVKARVIFLLQGLFTPIRSAAQLNTYRLTNHSDVGGTVLPAIASDPERYLCFDAISRIATGITSGKVWSITKGPGGELKMETQQGEACRFPISIPINESK